MTLDPRIRQLHDELADLPEAARRRRLDAISDPDVVAAVRRWLSTGVPPTLPTGAPAPQAPPERIAGYRLLHRLGAGGMGVVYAAEQSRPRRTVALKLLHPGREQDTDRLTDEAQALADVDHPGIPTVHEAGTTAAGQTYVVMERVDGPTLDRWLGREEATPAACVDLLIALADALDAAHRVGVLHRDLKPANIIVSDKGPRILDFGIAVALGGATRQEQGTPAYMSPEALRGDDLDVRADVFSLGRIAYELLTGRVPMGLPVPPASAYAPHLAPDLVRVLDRALAPDPQRRCPSARAFADDLIAVRDQRPLPWVPGLGYRLGTGARRHRRALAVVGLIGATLASTALAWVVRDAQLERLRETQAEDRRLLLDAALDDAVAQGDVAEARRRHDAFVSDPAHEGTRALARSWLDLAEHLAPLDRPAHLDAYAEAWFAAQAPADARQALVGLGRSFDAAGRWADLVELESALDDEARGQLADALDRAYVATRRFERVPAGLQPLADQVHRHRTTGERAFMAAWLPPDGTGASPWVAIGREALTVHRPDGSRSSVARPHPDGWTSSQSVLHAFGTDWLVSGDHQAAGVYALGDPSTPVVPLPASGLLTAVALPGPGRRLAVARSYPHRGVSIADLDTGTAVELGEALVGTRSDVLDIDVHDLDGDGQAELVVSTGAWSSYDVRVLARDGEGWRLAARAELGAVFDTVVVPGPEGPLLVAGKVDRYADAVAFGREAPYGPDAGLYLLRYRPDLPPDAALERVRHVPLPVPDDPRTGPERSAEDPLLGDLDGDGTLDLVWTLRRMHHDTSHSLWVLLDVLHDGPQAVLGGLEAYGAQDVDGDGDVELLVGDDEDRILVLGTGEAPMPPFTPVEPPASLGPPPSADPVVQRSWARAEQLVRLRLLPSAARSLARLPVEDPVARGAVRMAAADLHRRVGTLGPAADLYAEAAALGHAGARDALVRTRLSTLDLDGAMATAPDHPSLGGLEAGPTVELLDADLQGWALQRPAFTSAARGVWVDAFNDEGVLARRSVEVRGGWVELGLEGVVEALELGAGLGLELRRDGERLLAVAFWGQGGGGLPRLLPQCDATRREELDPTPLAPELSVALRAAVWTPPGGDAEVVCERRTGTEPARWTSFPAEPIPDGPAELVLRSYGDPVYHPPTRARVQLRHVTARGLVPAPTPSADAGARAWFEGRIATSEDPELAVLQGLASRQAPALDGLPDASIRRLLRRAPEATWRALQGRPDRAALAGAAWSEALREVQDIAIAEALLAMDPTHLAADAAADRALRLARARVLVARHRIPEARRDLEALVGSRDEDPYAVDAWLLLATLDRARPEAAWAHVERAAAVAPGPARVRARAERLGLRRP